MTCLVFTCAKIRFFLHFLKFFPEKFWCLTILYYLCTRKTTMAGELSWLERMIHNHEVPSSILGPATMLDDELQQCSSFFFVSLRHVVDASITGPESLSFTKLLYCKFILLLNFRKAHNKQIFRRLSSQANIAVLNVVAAFGAACLLYFPCFKCESSEK